MSALDSKDVLEKGGLPNKKKHEGRSLIKGKNKKRKAMQKGLVPWLKEC